MFDFINLLKFHPEIKRFKKEAKLLHKELNLQFDVKNNFYEKALTLMECQNIIVKNYGYNDWYHMQKTIKNALSGKNNVSNILRTKENIQPSNKYYNIGKDLLNNYLWMQESALRTHGICFGQNKNELLLHFLKEAINKNNKIMIFDASNNNLLLNKITKKIEEFNSTTKILDLRINHKNKIKFANIFNNENESVLMECFLNFIPRNKLNDIQKSYNYIFLITGFSLLTYLRNNENMKFNNSESVIRIFKYSFLIDALGKDEKINKLINGYIKNITEKNHNLIFNEFAKSVEYLFKLIGKMFDDNAPRIQEIMCNDGIFIKFCNEEEKEFLISRFTMSLVKSIFSDFFINGNNVKFKKNEDFFLVFGHGIFIIHQNNKCSHKPKIFWKKKTF